MSFRGKVSLQSYVRLAGQPPTYQGRSTGQSLPFYSPLPLAPALIPGRGGTADSLPPSVGEGQGMGSNPDFAIAPIYSQRRA